MDFKIIYKIIFALFIFLFCYNPLIAQEEDISYNHILSVSTYYNPSFAGTAGKYSLSNNFKSGDFGRKNSNMFSMYLSYDMYLNAVRGALGLIYFYNNTSPFEGLSRYCGFIYAPKINISNSLILSPSIKFGCYSNVDKLIEIKSQQEYDTIDVNKKNRDISAGLLISSSNMYAGVSVDHLLEPRINSNFINSDFIPVYKKYIIQYGYHYSRNEKGISFIHLNLLYQIQYKNNYFFVSNYFIGKKMAFAKRSNNGFLKPMLGVGYKMINKKFSDCSKNELFAGLGVQDNSLTMAVGFDMPTNTFKTKAIETSIKYTINYK